MSARIGPNAIIQTVAALETRIGVAPAAALLAASTGRTRDRLPERMVDETEVISLVHAIAGALPPGDTVEVMTDSGRRTAEYLIANRIPRVAQLVMRVVPRAAGLRILLGAIGRHSWTFAGSADVRITYGGTPRLALRRCPMCRDMRRDAPCCDYYTATLEHLVRRLIAPSSTVREVACEAAGADACVFQFDH